MQKIKKQLSPQELYQKLSYRCATCENAPYDIMQKAMQHGATAEQAQQIVDRLTDENFLNEQRYVKAFVNDKLTLSHWGKNKISAALRQKRITPSLISQELSEIDNDQYLDIMRDVLQTKSRQIKDNDPHTRMRKLIAFAASRGFEPSIVYDIINCI